MSLSRTTELRRPRRGRVQDQQDGPPAPPLVRREGLCAHLQPEPRLVRVRRRDPVRPQRAGEDPGLTKKCEKINLCYICLLRFPTALRRQRSARHPGVFLRRLRGEDGVQHHGHRFAHFECVLSIRKCLLIPIDPTYFLKLDEERATAFNRSRGSRGHGRKATGIKSPLVNASCSTVSVQFSCSTTNQGF